MVFGLKRPGNAQTECLQVYFLCVSATPPRGSPHGRGLALTQNACEREADFLKEEVGVKSHCNTLQHTATP